MNTENTYTLNIATTGNVAANVNIRGKVFLKLY